MEMRIRELTQAFCSVWRAASEAMAKVGARKQGAQQSAQEAKEGRRPVARGHGFAGWRARSSRRRANSTRWDARADRLSKEENSQADRVRKTGC